MAAGIDKFLDWFKKLSPQEQEEIIKHIYSTQGWTALKGVYGGPAPVSASSGVCPTCRRPL